MERFNKHNNHPKFIANQSILYTALVAIISVAYSLLVVGLSLILNKLFSISNPLIMGIAIFITAVLFTPLRQSLEKLLNQLFNKRVDLFQTHQQNFTAEITTIMPPEEIAIKLKSYIKQVIHPEQLHIYLYNASLEAYLAVSEPADEATEVIFRGECDLAHYLSEHEVLYLPDLNYLPAQLHNDESRLKLLASTIFLPIPWAQDERLNGWVALKTQQGNLNQEEREFLTSLCHQVGIAIDRSRVMYNLENRLQEMDVLTRISEGVNITLTLNDILELVYFQTSKIIPSDYFIIRIYDQELNTFLNLFFIEQNQRLAAKENKTVSANRLPEYDVLTTGSTRNIRHFNESEYRNDASDYNVENLNAWICTPLKTSDTIIGTITLSLEAPGVIYSKDQQKMLESIAGQISGAITKTRLLDETKQRAQQFSGLNDISQQLTSTFDLDVLLQTIVAKAEEMLDCEAGSLLLYDTETKELSFKVVTGPVADQLIGKSLTRDEGIAWTSVHEKRSIINNVLRDSKTWSKRMDADTGFETNSMMATPLINQGEVIGVIEIINKKNEMPFNEVDQEILEAFAGQAAIAIANARLYTNTDQALTDRIEELSIMQEIDRDLNTHLDTQRAMRITLDWAMAQSRADAGLIGSISENEIHVIASKGYHMDDLSQIDRLDISRFSYVDDALKQLRIVSYPIEISVASLLENAQRQHVIPITRNNMPIGVIVLDYKDDQQLSEEMRKFLIRLSDHASIAIYNAELYEQVQEASVAKSDFVSFVSHELKNPMTSIKGYTELLLANAVGPINDNQKNFLQTVKSNVERMAMLVSDLADVSRIEAGRLKLDFTQVDLSAATDEVIRSQQNQITAKDQKLIVEIEDHLPNIWADHFRVVQILTNLISNANKYTPDNGTILYHAEVTENQWDPDGAPQVIHIFVKDTGMGISEEDQTSIFQKFFRTDNAKISEAPGTGLGLNITKNLVEMQGGKIWFDSAVNHGTTFHVTFPIAG